MAKKKATLTTKAVAWNNDIPTKYQSILEFPVSENRTIRLMGDPKPTMDDSFSSLCEEVNIWEEAMAAFLETIRKEL